jgi:hypothetical protein
MGDNLDNNNQKNQALLGFQAEEMDLHLVHQKQLWSTFHKSLEITLIEASKGLMLVPIPEEELEEYEKEKQKEREIERERERDREREREREKERGINVNMNLNVNVNTGATSNQDKNNSKKPLPNTPIHSSVSSNNSIATSNKLKKVEASNQHTNSSGIKGGQTATNQGGEDRGDRGKGAGIVSTNNTNNKKKKDPNTNTTTNPLNKIKVVPFDTQGDPTSGIVEFVNQFLNPVLFSNNIREGGASPGFPRTLAYVLFDILPRPGPDKQPIGPDFEHIFFTIFGTRSFDVKCAMLYGLQRNVLQRTKVKTITVQVQVPVHHNHNNYHHNNYNNHHHHRGQRGHTGGGHWKGGHGSMETQMVSQTKEVVEIRDPVEYFSTLLNRLLKSNALVFGDLNSWITSQSSARTKIFASDVMERLKEFTD